jgi:hypothetical protein
MQKTKIVGVPRVRYQKMLLKRVQDKMLASGYLPAYLMTGEERIEQATFPDGDLRYFAPVGRPDERAILDLKTDQVSLQYWNQERDVWQTSAKEDVLRFLCSPDPTEAEFPPMLQSFTNILRTIRYVPVTAEYQNPDIQSFVGQTDGEERSFALVERGKIPRIFMYNWTAAKGVYNEKNAMLMQVMRAGPRPSYMQNTPPQRQVHIKPRAFDL